LKKEQKQIKTWMDSVPQDGRLGGERIPGIDQASKAAKFQCQRDVEAHRGSPSGNAAMISSAPQDWERKYRNQEVMDRRKQRGGATFRKGDAFAK
jgi:hypothetical protein